MSVYTLLHDAEASAYTSANPEPFRILSKHLLFPNFDEHEWWHKSGPMLARMLSAANYDVHQQYKYLLLYALHVVPMIGPFPCPDRPQLYRSPFTGIGALELSNNFTRSKTTVRMGMEPISYQATTGPDFFNRVKSGEMLSRLKQAGVNVDLTLYHQLIHRLTLSDEEVGAFLNGNDTMKLPFKSQTVVALDFGEKDAVVKLYLLPMLKSQATGVPCSELIFSAVKSVDTDGLFQDSLAVLEDYCVKLPPSASVYWTCFDLLNPKASRFKVYLLDTQVDFQRVTDLWMLGGRLTSPEDAKGLELLRELWEALNISGVVRQSAADPGQPDKTRESMYLSANYELQPSRSLQQPKIYLRLARMNDMSIAKAISSFIEKHVNAEQGRTYIDNITSFV
ncbi:uncharacterized protein LDX57_012740 [Aspergillus melleus]|uniref:uncharacterized protein n=1 Tax=Aspergillus melleus TaxID=138277 RepID=UPI001E8E0A86|nr:uncharacterized protein LDX57_012740 [Aspergillus melleus]KAH8435111.1 hypothetical protein LDX57_012740 [Aspergillus melleus]